MLWWRFLEVTKHVERGGGGGDEYVLGQRVVLGVSLVGVCVYIYI